ncbi:hypothetical protein Angca_003693, partial [Angiostrongylus cantonensis]
LMRTKNTRLRAHLFDSTVLPALTYASETWSLCKQITQRYRTRSRKDDAGSIPFHTILYAKQSKIRWAGHVMRMNNNRWIRAVSDWIP